MAAISRADWSVRPPSKEDVKSKPGEEMKEFVPGIFFREAERAMLPGMIREAYKKLENEQQYITGLLGGSGSKSNIPTGKSLYSFNSVFFSTNV
jgi:hypothetical protein